MKPGKEQIFGLGVTKAPFYEKTLYGHGGDTFGTHSIALYHEEDSIAVAMSINGGAMPFITPIRTSLKGMAPPLIDMATAILSSS